MTPVKIGFVLLSNSKHPMPSTRIAVLNMFPFLRAANFDPHIVFEPEHPTEMPNVSSLAPKLIQEDFRIVYFQKVCGPSVEGLARQLSFSGIKTIYGVCDFVDAAMAEVTDATITVTDYLKSLYPPNLQPKISVVHDGIEHPEIYKDDWGSHQGSRNRPLRAVLVTAVALDHIPLLGTLPEWLQVSIVGRYPPTDLTLQRFNSARWNLLTKKGFRKRLSYLRFLANRRIQCLAWDPVGVYEAMRRADIGIIPIETTFEHASEIPPPSWKLRSENRLTLKMCVGLPVIATPIPSYEPVIEQGKNGFLAKSQQDWIEYLEVLRDPKSRRTIGRQARESVLDRYSMQEQARQLLKVLFNLSSIV